MAWDDPVRKRHGLSAVPEIPRTPRAPIELSEDELLLAMKGCLRVDGAEALYEKFSRTLAIESNPGGNFDRGGDAA